MSDYQAAEKMAETAMVDLTYDLLKDKGEPMHYRDIMNEIAKMKGFTKDDVEQYIAQLYTEVNIDGRFICVGRSLWGVRDWYPTEQATDSAVAANVKDDYLDEEVEDALFDEDEENFAGDLEEIEEVDEDFEEDEEPPFDGEMEEDSELSDEDEDEEEL
ncbi:DNA-directed RNA polymerase subunit delta [Hazenella coriacea]|uniref:Probable DNA-directed RNA polymerase subunit delta n=1 Tax=Hazenella coriacea TaxID=1179467 RepID=A0A4R3L711_9BACL|nr:DNA-directed RNA polymerase subunit delta [Hazenella coriacea]TCS95553.1 DNA-directed RNA polymerase subunit delta [Hazenella coriacea]